MQHGGKLPRMLPEWDMHCASAAGQILIDHAIPNVDMHAISVHGTSTSGQIVIDDIPYVGLVMS